MNTERKNAVEQWISGKMAHMEVHPPESAWQHIIAQNIQTEKTKSSFSYQYAAAIALIFLTISGSFYLAYQHQPTGDVTAETVSVSESTSTLSAVKPAVEEKMTATHSTEKVTNRPTPKEITPESKENNPESPVTSPDHSPEVVETKETQTSPEGHEVDYPVYNLRILPNEKTTLDTLQVISPQVIRKGKNKK